MVMHRQRGASIMRDHDDHVEPVELTDEALEAVSAAAHGHYHPSTHGQYHLDLHGQFSTS
jgi:hypothetical protein